MSAPKIPILDLKAQNASIRAEAEKAIARVLDSNTFIMGPEVTALEGELASYLGVKHAIGVSSGTDALLVALMALDIGAGDEVIIPPFTFFATAGCVSRTGAKPVFVDIDPATFNLDPAKLAAAITPRTKAIIPVHLFGQPCDMAAIRKVAAAHKLAVIEDAAQAIGSSTAEGKVGGLGTLACFSFFPSKNLGCFGDGGLVTTNDADLAEKVRVLRTHGSKAKYLHAFVGGNFRLDALQAAVLRVKLPHLDGWAAGRIQNAARYDALFRAAELSPETLRTPLKTQPGHVYNQYVIRTNRRDELQKHLEAEGIGTMIYYPLSLHLQECFADLGYKAGAFPESERATAEVLALPIFPELGDGVDRVANTVVAFLRRAAA